MTESVLLPIDDGLVLGRLSPIGHVAVGKALSLLTTTQFEHVLVEDDVIGDVLARSAILRKISPEQVIRAGGNQAANAAGINLSSWRSKSKWIRKRDDVRPEGR